MRATYNSVFSIACVFLGACGGATDETIEGQSAGPITGGTTDSSRPAVCGLVDPSTEQIFCTGTLVSVDPPRVVTAAHCLVNTAPSQVAVGFGPSETSWDVVLPVAQVVVHPDYNPNFNTTRPSDIAYVDLVSAPEGVSAIPANSASLADREGESWLFMGYGVDHKVWLKRVGKGPYSWEGAGTKRSVSIPIATISDPRGEFDYYAQDSGEAEAKNTCFGDSGGPALAPVAGVERVVGVTSRGASDCGAIGAIGIDTRVDTFSGFLSGEPLPPPVCGDEVCDAAEACDSCPSDCGDCAPPGGQCSSCSADTDCASGARCFRLTSESAPACHLACSVTADCPSGYSCARITSGFGKRCVACE